MARKKRAKRKSPRERVLASVEKDLVAALRAGDRVEVMRTKKPFFATVERVNPKGFALIADDGRRWRVPKRSAKRYLRKVGKVGKRRGAVATKAPAKRTRATTKRAASSGRAATAQLRGSSSQKRAQIGARAREIARSYPRQTHFMDGRGGRGVSGFLWFQKKGLGKFIPLSTNGELSYEQADEIGRRLAKEFAPATSWFNLD